MNAARYNLDVNGIKNAHIARLSSEEFTQAWRGDREFFRMKDFPDIKGRKFKTLLVGFFTLTGNAARYTPKELMKVNGLFLHPDKKHKGQVKG